MGCCSSAFLKNAEPLQEEGDSPAAQKAVEVEMAGGPVNHKSVRMSVFMRGDLASSDSAPSGKASEDAPKVEVSKVEVGNPFAKQGSATERGSEPQRKGSSGNPFAKTGSATGRKESSGNPFGKQGSTTAVPSDSSAAASAAAADSVSAAASDTAADSAADSVPAARKASVSTSNPFGGTPDAIPAANMAPSGMPPEKGGILKKRSPTAGA
jgi:hypothetical protein